MQFIMNRWWYGLFIGIILLISSPAGATEVSSGSEEPSAEPVNDPKPGLGARLLWYIPSRCMDLVDIFRLRARVGPGLSVNVRLTDYGAFYIGRYRSVFAGLPGPRYPDSFRWPAGYEKLNGVVLFGVDATDDTLHGPRYSRTEVDVGAQLLLVGVEAGVDPIELADFLLGFILFDIRDDDFPRKTPELPEYSSALSIGLGEGSMRIEEKPLVFESFETRLDYLQNNVQKRVDTPVRSADEWFAADGTPIEKSNPTRIKLGLFTDIEEDEGVAVQFKPEIKIEVELPNMEHRLDLFVETAQADDLPGTRPTEREDKGLTIGVGKYFDKYKITTDAGVRTRWPPEVYGRISWRPKWTVGEWDVRPEERVFWENEDGFGTLAKLGLSRWLGDAEKYVFRSQSAGRITEDKPGIIRWEETISFGRVDEMLQGSKKHGFVDFEDTSSAYGISYSLFGNDTILREHRVTLGYRFPLYHKWIFGDIQPGLEWLNNDDWETAYRITFGIEMLFWGSGSG